MLFQIERADQRFREIDILLSSPEIHNDRDRVSKLLKERKQLQPISEKYQEYIKAEERITEAKLLLAEENDSELRTLAEGEIRDASSDLERILDELRLLLLASDPKDERNVILEIRAGAGGEEAALFAADLFRMYTMYAERNGLSVEPLEANRTELGGFRQISFLVSGDSVFGTLKFESGVHRVQRVPETESQGRIQTSTVTVAVLPEAEDVEVEILPSEIRFESCKSSGAGGQHINKTESAVRLTHVPSGIVIECQEERSQFKNRDKAMKLLKAKLFEIKQREQSESIAEQRRTQVGTGDRSERIRTYNFPQGRVTDHRIGLTLHKIDAFMNGDISEMLDALRSRELAERLKEQSDKEAYSS